MQDIESRIQQACMQWLSIEYPAIWEATTAIPNGGQRPTFYRRDKMGRYAAYCPAGAKLKREGVKAGVSDVIIFIPTEDAASLHIEFKTGKGRQSEGQKVWQQVMEKNGNRYVVIRSLEGFIELINQHYGNKR